MMRDELIEGVALGSGEAVEKSSNVLDSIGGEGSKGHHVGRGYPKEEGREVPVGAGVGACRHKLDGRVRCRLDGGGEGVGIGGQ